MKHNLIIISNDTETSMNLMGVLMDEQIEVDYVALHEEGIKQFLNGDYCLAVIDIAAKQSDNLSWLSEIKSKKNALVLLLAPNNCALGEVICFEKGADEYMKKPFSTELCVAKIKILLNRYCSRA